MVNTENWVAWLPQWVIELPIQATTNLVVQGVVEASIGLLLLVGLFTRVAAAAAVAIVTAIILTVGFNEISVRDFAILTIAVALAFSKSHPFSLDEKRKR